MSNFKIKLSGIKAFAFDVDGVFTDGTVLAMEDGNLLRSHNAKDGFAVKMAILKGFEIAIITGGSSNSIIKRFKHIGVKEENIYLKSHHKILTFNDFCDRNGLKREEVIYMGDDLPDIPVMRHCGLPVCPSDAADEVKAISQYISLYKGGEGCVRDIIEQTLKIHKQWEFDPIAYSG